MAAALPLPIGVTTRALPDKYASLLSAGHAVIGNVAGNNAYIGVYNNATDGTVLRIYSVDLQVNAGTFVYFEWDQGNPGTVYTADGLYGAIDPRTYATPGQMITFQSAVCVGSHIGGLNMYSTQNREFRPGWPIAIIPPNYSFLCQIRNQNVGFECAIQWLPVPGPLTPRT